MGTKIFQWAVDQGNKASKQADAELRKAYQLCPNTLDETKAHLVDAAGVVKAKAPALIQKAADVAKPRAQSALGWAAQTIHLDQIRERVSGWRQQAGQVNARASIAAGAKYVGKQCLLGLESAAIATGKGLWAAVQMDMSDFRQKGSEVKEQVKAKLGAAKDAVVENRSTVYKTAGTIATAAGTMALTGGIAYPVIAGGAVAAACSSRARTWLYDHAPAEPVKEVVKRELENPTYPTATKAAVVGAATLVGSYIPWVGWAAPSLGMYALNHLDDFSLQTAAKVFGATAAAATGSAAGGALVNYAAMANAAYQGGRKLMNGATREEARKAATDAYLLTRAGTALVPAGVTEAVASLASAVGAAAGAGGVGLATNPPKGTVRPPPLLVKYAGFPNAIHFDEQAERPENRASCGKVLDEIAAKINDFANSPHPANHYWKDPVEEQKAKYEDFVLKTLPDAVKQAARDKLDELRNAADDKKKEDEVDVIFKANNILNLPAGLEMRGVIPVLETLPTSRHLAEAKRADLEMSKLVDQGATFSMLYFVHVKVLGNEQTDAVEKTFQKIIADVLKAKKRGEKVTVWDLYWKQFGKDLPWYYDALIARFLFWICEDRGVVLNLFKGVSDNFMKNIREGLEGMEDKDLHDVAQKTLRQISTFLDIYGNASRNYIKEQDVKQGALYDYQQIEINRMGNDQIYQKVMKENPGASPKIIGEKMMEELCREFTHTMIDLYMPTISPLHKLTKIPGLGLLFRALGALGNFLMSLPYYIDYFFIGVIGILTLGLGVIDLLARRYAKKKLPEVTHSLVKTGLNKTLPGQYPFKIALAKFMTDQLKDLQNDRKEMDTSKPVRFADSEAEEGFLRGAVKKLLEELYIKRIGDNATQNEVREQLEKIKNKEYDQDLNEILEKALVKGAQIFIDHYTKRPEKVENLFANLIELLNKTFEVGGSEPGEDEYRAAVKEMKKVSRELVVSTVQEEIEEISKGDNQERVKAILEGRLGEDGELVQKGLFGIQKDHGVQTFGRLHVLAQSMIDRVDHPENEGDLLRELHEYAEGLRQFSVHAQSMNVDLYTLDAIKDEFNQRFFPIYSDANKLAKQTLDLQKPQILFDKYSKLLLKLKEIQELCTDGERNPFEFERTLEELEEIIQWYSAHHKYEDLGSANHEEEIQNLLVQKHRAQGAAKAAIDRQIRELKAHTAQLELEQQFKTLKTLIERLSSAQAKWREEQGIVKKLKDLRNPATFADNLLIDSKRWVEVARNSIPAEDWAPFEALVKELQANYHLDPRPNLAALKAQIAAELVRILNKHDQAMQTKQVEINEILQNFAAHTVTFKEKISDKEEELKRKVKARLNTLKSSTKNLLDKVTAIQITPIRFMGSDILEWIARFRGNQILRELIGDEGDKKGGLVDTVFEFITSSSIYEGAARRLMGTIIENERNK
jgi:hypothetical protein